MKQNLSPWKWVPTLYFAEGLPYVAVMVLSLVMYKRMGISNTEVALYTSWLNLPWVIKPLWSPFVDLLKTKRWWIVSMQLLIGAGLAGIAFTIPAPHFFQTTLALFWLTAFGSATHDIAADGFYMLALTSHQQALYVGIRSTCYRIATIAGQGLLIMLAGYLEKTSLGITYAWSLTFFVLSGLFLGLWVYHVFCLPRPEQAVSAGQTSASGLFQAFLNTFRSFFQKEQAGIALLFMLLYRLPEAQLAKMSIPFLIDTPEVGGLGMTTEQLGFAQGTIGTIGLTLGGILGGCCSCPSRAQTVALAYGMGHLPSGYRLCLSQLCRLTGTADHQRLYFYGTIRLWLRFYGLHAVPDLFLPRYTTNGSLCHLYCLYGFGHDAPGHDCRLASGKSGLSVVLHLDHGMHTGHFRCHGFTENRSGVWQEIS